MAVYEETKLTLIWANLGVGYLISLDNLLYLQIGGRIYRWSEVVKQRGNYKAVQPEALQTNLARGCTFLVAPEPVPVLEKWVGVKPNEIPKVAYNNIKELQLKEYWWGWTPETFNLRKNERKSILLSANLTTGFVYYDVVSFAELCKNRRGRYMNIKITSDNDIAPRNEFVTTMLRSQYVRRTATYSKFSMCADTVRYTKILRKGSDNFGDNKYLIKPYMSKAVDEANTHELGFNRLPILKGYGNFGRYKYDVAIVDILFTNLDIDCTRNHYGWGFFGGLSAGDKPLKKLRYGLKQHRIYAYHDFRFIELIYDLLKCPYDNEIKLAENWLERFRAADPGRKSIDITPKMLLNDAFTLVLGYIKGVMSVAIKAKYNKPVAMVRKMDMIATMLTTRRADRLYKEALFELFMYCVKLRYTLLNVPFECRLQNYTSLDIVQPYTGNRINPVIVNYCRVFEYCGNGVARARIPAVKIMAYNTSHLGDRITSLFTADELSDIFKMI